MVTMREVITLDVIVKAASGCQRVRWEDDQGNLQEGTARSIGDCHGYFAPHDADLYDQYLRVTTVAGWDAWLPIRDLAAKVEVGLFAVDA